MKKRFRLTRTKDFERVKDQGNILYHPLLVLSFTERCDQPSRMAVVASKSVGKAVMRNKMKRKLRACLNARVKNVKNGWDLVFFSRPKIVHATYQEICSAVEHLLKKANVWQDNA